MLAVNHKLDFIIASPQKLEAISSRTPKLGSLTLTCSPMLDHRAGDFLGVPLRAAPPVAVAPSTLAVDEVVNARDGVVIHTFKQHGHVEE